MSTTNNSRVARTGVLLGKTRYLALLAVVGLGATTVATFVWSLAKSVKLIGVRHVVLDGRRRRAYRCPDLLPLAWEGQGRDLTSWLG
jgi:hypothetical protein